MDIFASFGLFGTGAQPAGPLTPAILLVISLALTLPLVFFNKFREFSLRYFFNCLSNEKFLISMACFGVAAALKLGSSESILLKIFAEFQEDSQSHAAALSAAAQVLSLVIAFCVGGVFVAQQLQARANAAAAGTLDGDEQAASSTQPPQISFNHLGTGAQADLPRHLHAASTSDDNEDSSGNCSKGHSAGLPEHASTQTASNTALDGPDANAQPPPESAPPTAAPKRKKGANSKTPSLSSNAPQVEAQAPETAIPTPVMQTDRTHMATEDAQKELSSGPAPPASLGRGARGQTDFFVGLLYTTIALIASLLVVCLFLLTVQGPIVVSKTEDVSALLAACDGNSTRTFAIINAHHVFDGCSTGTNGECRNKTAWQNASDACLKVFERFQSEKREADSVKSDRDDFKGKLEGLQSTDVSKIEKARRDLEQCAKKKFELEVQSGNDANERDALNEQITTLTSERDDLKYLNKQIDSDKSRLASEKAGLQGDKRRLEKELGDMKVELERVNRKLESEKKALEKSAQRVKDLEKTVASYAKENENQLEKLMSCEGQLRSARSNLEDLKQQLQQEQEQQQPPLPQPSQQQHREEQPDAWQPQQPEGDAQADQHHNHRGRDEL